MWHLCPSRFPQLILLVYTVRAVSAENMYSANCVAARSNWHILKLRQEAPLLGCQLEHSSLPQVDLGGKSNCKWFHFLVDQILNQCWVMDGLGVKGKAVWEQPGIWEKCDWCSHYQCGNILLCRGKPRLLCNRSVLQLFVKATRWP